MGKIILLLFIISVGVSAYVKARRKGTWSWPLFAKAVAGALVLGAAVGIAATWAARSIGPDHAFLITFGAVIVIAAGVVVLTIWVGGKKGTGKNRMPL